MKYPTMCTFLTAVFLCANVGAALPAPDDTAFDFEHWHQFYANMTLVLLDDSARPGDGEAVAEELLGIGGSAPVVFGTEAVIASMPAEAPLPSVGRGHVRSVHRSQVPLLSARGRRDAEAAVKYFNAAISGTLYAQLIEMSYLPPMPRASSDVYPTLPGGSSGGSSSIGATSVGVEAWEFRPAPMWYGRNASMNGRIRATLFFVQCQNAPECLFTWTQAAVDDVTNRTVSGYQFWGDVGQAYGKSPVFTVVAYSPIYDSRVNVSVEPVRYPSGVHPPGTNEWNDSLWIDPIMANFGYGSGNEFDRVRAYTGAILSGGYYSSAFCSFIANNAGSTAYTTYGGTTGDASYAYLGNFSVLLSDPFTHRDYISLVTAHETGHIFWACDEYGACSCQVCNNQAPDDRPPGNNAPNANCVSCGGAGCIMKDDFTAYGNRQMCSYTAQHVGWPAYPCFATVPASNWSVTYYNDVYDPTTGTYSHWTQGAVARYDEGTGFINHDWGAGSPSTGNCSVNADPLFRALQPLCHVHRRNAHVHGDD
jgi:hypothetical protein